MPSGAEKPEQRSIESCSTLAAAGDKAAIAELHDRLSVGLTRHFARKLAGSTGGPNGRGGRGGWRGSDVAEELAQQTWLAFWQAITNQQYDASRARLSTFLYAIAANIWLRHVRVSSRNVFIKSVQCLTADADDAVDWPLTGTHDDPAEVMHTASLLDAVRRAVDGTLASTPAPGAATFAEPERALLRAIGQGMTDRQLAAELGVSPSTAHARKRSLLTRLAQVLRGQGFSGPETGPARHEYRQNLLIHTAEPAANEPVLHDNKIKRESQPFPSETKQQRLGTP